MLIGYICPNCNKYINVEQGNNHCCTSNKKSLLFKDIQIMNRPDLFDLDSMRYLSRSEIKRKEQETGLVFEDFRDIDKDCDRNIKYNQEKMENELHKHLEDKLTEKINI